MNVILQLDYKLFGKKNWLHEIKDKEVYPTTDAEVKQWIAQDPDVGANLDA